MDHFEVFIKFATIWFWFYVFWFWGHDAYGILASQPGIELEGEVLTTGPLGKSHAHTYYRLQMSRFSPVYFMCVFEVVVQ